MPWMRRLATIAAAAEAARRYAKSNPDQAAKYLDQAAAFVDKQTKGRYTAQISGAADKVKGVAGVPTKPRPAAGSPTANGFSHGGPTGYSAPGAGATPPPAAPPTSSNATDPTVVTPKPAPKPAPPSGRPTEG